ncbi:MAG: trypsin-like peptidase domain-containing protein [Pseudomonadota bacterium]
MADSAYLLSKNTLDPETLLQLSGTPVLERNDALREALTRGGSLETARLFAEPVLSRGNGAAPTSVSWYTSVSGDARRLSELDDDARAAAERKLTARLANVTPLLRDPAMGPLAGAVLHLASPDDIWVIAGEPVLTNWGVAPAEAMTTKAGRDAHFQSTLGRFMPLSEAPAVSAEEWRLRGGPGFADPTGSAAPTGAGAAGAAAMGAGAGMAAGAAMGATAGAATPGTGQGATMGAAPGTPPGATPGAGAVPGGGGGINGGGTPVYVERSGGGAWRWVPLGILLTVATGVLIWLLIPGTLLYPPQPAARVVDDEQARIIAAEANRALEERAEELRRAINGAVCTPEGDLVLPGGATPENLTPGARAAAGEDPVEANPGPALIPPNPARIRVPDEDAPPPAEGETAEPQSLPTLLTHLEARTALVLVNGPSGSGHGSGFFVAPDLLMTNHHVVAGGGQGAQIFVTNEQLGTLTPATLLGSNGPLEETGADFALLRVEGAQMPFFTLRESSATMRLQNVIAAGYPGFVLETDAQFAALMGGDVSALPALTVTDGIVNVEQNLTPVTRVLVHTARISPGNSGGPLVDSCGRVVGVNTFGRLNNETLQALNFSLDSADALGFLRENGATARVATDECRPQVAGVATPPRPADPGEAGPVGGDDAPAPGAEATPEAEAAPVTGGDAPADGPADGQVE